MSVEFLGAKKPAAPYQSSALVTSSFKTTSGLSKWAVPLIGSPSGALYTLQLTGSGCVRSRCFRPIRGIGRACVFTRDIQGPGLTRCLMRQAPLIDNYLDVEMKQLAGRDSIVPLGGKRAF